MGILDAINAVLGGGKSLKNSHKVNKDRKAR